MKKFWMILFIILGFVGIGIFSISFGNEENEEQKVDYPYTTRKGYSRVFENTFWIKHRK